MRIVAIIILVLLCYPMAAQQPNRTDLEKRRQGLMEAIKQTQEQLEATKKDKNATMGELRALQNKLAQRQKLIGNINQELYQIDNSIKTSSNEVVKLREDLGTLKLRYAQSVRYAYKSRSSYDMLAFLFSSNDFNDALRRMKYLKKYRDYRKQQAEQIRVTQGEIERKIGVLNSERTQKDVLRMAEEQQRLAIQRERDETDQVVKSLKGREKQLMANIEKDRKSTRQLDKTINDLIRREIEIARKKAEEEQRRKAEEERKRKEEEARRAATYAGGVNVATGSGSPSKPGTTAPKGNTAAPANNNASATKPGATTTTTARPKPVANESLSYRLSLTPEVAALSNSFESNRGKLPWPVEKGFIAESFGRHQHAVAEKVMVDNNGLEIQTSANAMARAIFDGTVSAIMYVPGMGQSVLINHGQYFTVYSRLSNVMVKKGEAVRIKQPLGNVTLNDENVPMIHFELWKVSNSNPSPIDPATWIAR